VELCWDTSTTTDLDLYLHRPNSTAPWFDPAAYDVIHGMNDDTCNTANCGAKPRTDLGVVLARADWGNADSPLAWCTAGPSAADFLALGRCPNPRAGVDNNQDLATGTSEVIQLDNPDEGGTYRVMAQNFDNNPAAPEVFVYCAGRLAGSFGPPPRPPRFVAQSRGVFGVMWRAVDITATLDGAGTAVGCAAVEVPKDQAVTIDDPRY
jgi:hypothetical protein